MSHELSSESVMRITPSNGQDRVANSGGVACDRRSPLTLQGCYKAAVAYFSLARNIKDCPARLAATPPTTFTGPNMTRKFKDPVRCAALVVVFLLAGPRGELTLAQ